MENEPNMAHDEIVPAIETTSEETDEVSGTKADSTHTSEFSTKTWRDDLTLVVEDKKLFVSKTVLGLASPVFETMFTAEFQEKDKGEIALPDKSYSDMVEFLKCIYPSIMNPVTLSNVYKVLPLADEYQIKWLKPACEPCLLAYVSDSMKKNDKYDILHLACIYNLPEVKARCIDIICSQPYEEFEAAAKKIKFPDDVQSKIKGMLLKNLHLSFNTLDAKHKALSSRHQISEVLNRFLGVECNREELVSRYLNGKMKGDYVKLAVGSNFSAKTQISLGNLCFSVSLKLTTITKPANIKGSSLCNYENIIEAIIDCKTQKCQSGLFGIVIQNWMTGKDDFKHEAKVTLSRETQSCSVRLGKPDTYFTDETAGFICKGKIECTLYLFIYE